MVSLSSIAAKLKTTVSNVGGTIKSTATKITDVEKNALNTVKNTAANTVSAIAAGGDKLLDKTLEVQKKIVTAAAQDVGVVLKETTKGVASGVEEASKDTFGTGAILAGVGIAAVAAVFALKI